MAVRANNSEGAPIEQRIAPGKRNVPFAFLNRCVTMFACPLEIMRPPDTSGGEWLTPRSIIQPAPLAPWVYRVLVQ